MGKRDAFRIGFKGCRNDRERNRLPRLKAVGKCHGEGHRTSTCSYMKLYCENHDSFICRIIKEKSQPTSGHLDAIQARHSPEKRSTWSSASTMRTRPRATSN